MILDTTKPVKILGKNKQQELILKYILSSVPTNKWALFFNSRPTPFSVKVVINGEKAFIIVTGQESAFMMYDPLYDPNDEKHNVKIIVSPNIINFLTTYIETINAEESNDIIKEEILLANYTPGMIIIHNSLSKKLTIDSDNDGIADKSEYEKYIKMVSNRIYI